MSVNLQITWLDIVSNKGNHHRVRCYLLIASNLLVKIKMITSDCIFVPLFPSISLAKSSLNYFFIHWREPNNKYSLLIKGRQARGEK